MSARYKGKKPRGDHIYLVCSLYTDEEGSSRAFKWRWKKEALFILQRSRLRDDLVSSFKYTKGIFMELMVIDCSPSWQKIWQEEMGLERVQLNIKKSVFICRLIK